MSGNQQSQQFMGQHGTYPHHGVYHPNTPGKIKVVFNLSAEYQGRYLNGELLSGPGLINQIVRALLGSREEPVGVTGDIQAMFHQVKVPDDQSSFLRFHSGITLLPPKK